eukprot:CAMPEP_0169242628 /NCGR_PEP_ID=MMETSP1016-20121227/32648_1 /TAXON_ID=342587 /ORGANISM="Karlodinium micrum, Strain CCMP2283" /LENGTH=160 /DNA_ID=CAMNT_0009322845 /DNA_START=202 /DNA_END=680 /DNA_ORIENTATION=+
MTLIDQLAFASIYSATACKTFCLILVIPPLVEEFSACIDFSFFVTLPFFFEINLCLFLDFFSFSSFFSFFAFFASLSTGTPVEPALEGVGTPSVACPPLLDGSVFSSELLSSSSSLDISKEVIALSGISRSSSSADADREGGEGAAIVSSKRDCATAMDS